MIDEFIYQFQTFCQFRQRAKFRSDEEVAALKAHPAVFTAQGVLTYLHALHEKGQQAALKDTPLHAMAGYFAKVLQGRVGVLGREGGFHLPAHTAGCTRCTRRGSSRH
jgi:hypothetical protein